MGQAVIKSFVSQYTDVTELLEKAIIKGATLTSAQKVEFDVAARPAAVKVAGAGAAFLLWPHAALVLAVDRGAPTVASIKRLVACGDLGGAISLYSQWTELADKYVYFTTQLVRQLPLCGGRAGRRNLKARRHLHRCPHPRCQLDAQPPNRRPAFFHSPSPSPPPQRYSYQFLALVVDSFGARLNAICFETCLLLEVPGELRCRGGGGGERPAA